MTPELIKQRCARLVTDRSTAEGMWQKIESQIAPYRGMFQSDATSESSIQLDKGEIFDGTALQSAQTLAANLHGNLTSPYVQWFGLSFAQEALNDDTEARTWLEECAERVWKTLQKSNFSKEIAEAYLDLTTFATTFMFEEAKEKLEWDGVLFNSVPLKECYFEEDSEGRIAVFYRKLKYTALQMVDKFGDECPDDIKDMAKTVTATSTKHDVIFCVWKRKPKKEMAGGKLPPKRRAWGSRYIMDKDHVPLSDEGGYYEMPVFVTRWAKVSESEWGHGPSHVAIYDVQALNRQEMLTLTALELVVMPPQKTTERGVLGDLDLQPGGLTVVRAMDDLKPLSVGTEWQVLDAERQNRRNMIREYYMISKLDLKESPAMTATEVERRWQQMQKLLGPTLGRIQSDLLSNVIENTFALMLRAGRMPELPEVLKEAGIELDIEYTGPLPVAQKADIAGAIERELGLASNLAATYGAEALDSIDIARGIKEHARLTAVPAKIMRSDAEIKKRAVAREAEKKQAMALQAGQAQAEALKNAGAGAASLAQAKEAGGTGEMPGMPAANEEGGVDAEVAAG